MKKIKKQNFIVDQGTYPFDIFVCIGMSDEEVYKEIDKSYDLSEEEKESLVMSGNGRTVVLHGGQTILRMSNDIEVIDFYATLPHEVFHVVEFLFDRIGIKHDVETSGEAYAYQIQYIMGSILSKLKG